MMRLYVEMGCRETWTCAPYQLVERPGFGEQIAWAESNAIVFANSVLGARTERYGDFIDICAAIIGLVPEFGLHTDEGRLATVVIEVRGMPDATRGRDTFFAMLGHVVGRQVGTSVPVIDGIDRATEDQLKALGAAAASSGAVAMFHMVGVTPEASTRRDALGGRLPERTIVVGPTELAAATAELTTSTTRVLGAVSVGTPHYSFAEFERLRSLLAGRTVSADIEFFASTGRDTLARIDANGWADELQAQGVRIVTDTCTYVTPILTGRPGAVMTDSAKWAWYAPGNLGYEVVFASLDECVESAVRGEVWRDAGSGRRAREPAPATQVMVAGDAEGDVLVLTEPLSFWGGVDEQIRRRHRGPPSAARCERHRPCPGDAGWPRLEFQLERAGRAHPGRARAGRHPPWRARPDHRARRARWRDALRTNGARPGAARGRIRASGRGPATALGRLGQARGDERLTDRHPRVNQRPSPGRRCPRTRPS